MTLQDLTDTAATVIMGLRVRAGCEEKYLAWQQGLNTAASTYPGFIAAEINPPTAVQPDWGVIYRFDTIANLQAWFNSATRQDRLAAGRAFLDRPPTQQVIRGSAKPPDQLVTVAVTHHIDPDDYDEFLLWQERLRLAENNFPGFRGTELFRPIDGVQDEWTVLYRYNTAADLDRWLTSPERQRLLTEGNRFRDFNMRVVDNSFGSWFAFDEKSAETLPSKTKTSIAVWVGLYPTVVLLTLALSPLRLPLWIGMLGGNLMSSFIITFLIMPYYVNPLLKQWLWPPPGTPTMKSNVRALGIVAAVMAAWTVVIYLVTRVLWHLP
jgi:hypothetical protein